MKRAVITGATGAIGTALVKKLINENIDVLILIREKSVHKNNIPIHPLVKTAVCSLEDIKNFKVNIDAPFDAFFHLAWAGTFGAERNDMMMQTRNIEYTLDAVELASRLGCTVFVGAGSQAELGRLKNGVKVSSRLHEHPESGYGIAKLAAGRLSRIRCSQLGIRHVWGRILSVYGPNDGRYTLTTSAIREFLKGNSGSFTEGKQIWDYIYSSDAANALFLMAQKGEDGKIYSIGSGNEAPLSEYIEKIKDSINPSINIGFGAVPYNENQVMYLCADISELSSDTGFYPSVSFEDGIRKTIEWYKDVNGLG